MSKKVSRKEIFDPKLTHVAVHCSIFIGTAWESFVYILSILTAYLYEILTILGLYLLYVI